MDKRIEGLKAYLDRAHSVYHAVAGLAEELTKAGYTQLAEGGQWQLASGGKYFLTRGNSAVIAFRIPESAPTGFLMTSSHSDRPAFKVKENGELSGTYTRIAHQTYGGMLMGTWMDRPLSVAGRVCVETENGVQSRLVDIDRDLLLNSNMAIHMNRQANDGVKLNPAIDTLAMLGGENAKGKLDTLVEEAAGGKVLGRDLYLYVRQPATVWGLEEEYISGPALDDLQCAWCCTQGFLNSRETAGVPVLCVFDGEEAGSASVQGADSTLLEDVLRRICGCCGWNLEQMLQHSFMVSADNAHAIHPNHPEMADSANAPRINNGIVLKYNSNQKYTTDGVSAAILRKICAKAEVPVQTYYNRADLPGGSTLGRISLAHVSVLTADIGLPQLAMHACYETAGTQDSLYLMDAMAAFYGSTLQSVSDGNYILK